MANTSGVVRWANSSWLMSGEPGYSGGSCVWDRRRIVSMPSHGPSDVLQLTGAFSFCRRCVSTEPLLGGFSSTRKSATPFTRRAQSRSWPFSGQASQTPRHSSSWGDSRLTSPSRWLCRWRVYSDVTSRLWEPRIGQELDTRPSCRVCRPPAGQDDPDRCDW